VATVDSKNIVCSVIFEAIISDPMLEATVNKRLAMKSSSTHDRDILEETGMMTVILYPVMRRSDDDDGKVGQYLVGGPYCCQVTGCTRKKPFTQLANLKPHELSKYRQGPPNWRVTREAKREAIIDARVYDFIDSQTSLSRMKLPQDWPIVWLY
jgi:hypothetical protein